MTRGKGLLVGLAIALLAWVAWAQRPNPLSGGQWATVTAGVLLVLWVGLLQLGRPVLQYLVLCRFPLFTSVSLLTFPVLAATAARPVLGNLFSLAPFGFGVLVFLAFFLGWVALMTLVLIGQLAPARFDVEPLGLPPWMQALLDSRWGLVLTLLLASPTIAVAWLESPGSPGWKLAATLAGLAAAVGLIGLLLAVRNRLVREPDTSGVLLHENRSPFLDRRRVVSRTAPRPPHRRAPRTNWIRSFLDWVPESLCARISAPFWRGYIYKDTQDRWRFHHGHLFNMLLVLATGLVYVAFYLVQTPGRSSFDLFPAVVYTMLLMILGTFVLSAASFFLDRYRVPTLLLVTAASFFSLFITDTDHYYRTQPAPVSQALDPAAAFRAWRAARSREGRDGRQGGQPPVVVAVTAVGGGITTGLWTDHVLANLDREMGEGFIPSIALVSGVSGGSVGTLHFMDALADPVPGSSSTLAARLAQARDNVAKPSLPEAIWGLAYPDFWRTLPGPWFRWKGVEDRGDALERAWSRHLRHPESTLAGWREEIRAGRLPVPIFNTTISETGGRLLLTPVDVPRDWRAYGFSRVYPELDVKAVTAARLSAAFPYVSPMARPRLSDPKDRRGYHLADGGYYDNFGVASLVDWLRTVLPELRKVSGRRRILLVQIRDAPRVDPQAGIRTGWVVGALGPLKTLLSIRTATQTARNEMEVDLFQRLACRQGVQVESFIFTLKPEAGEKADPLPLSWQLTPEERERIERRWSTRDNRIELCRARICFETGSDAVCAAAREHCRALVEGMEPLPPLPAGDAPPPCPPTE